MGDDNIFDEDDALDYIIYEDCKKEDQKPEGKSGCLGLVLLIIAPACSMMLYLRP